MLLSFVKFQCDCVVNNRWKKGSGETFKQTVQHRQTFQVLYIRPETYSLLLQDSILTVWELLTVQTGIRPNTADQHTHSCVEQVQPDCGESPTDKSRHLPEVNVCSPANFHSVSIWWMLGFLPQKTVLLRHPPRRLQCWTRRDVLMILSGRQHPF